MLNVGSHGLHVVHGAYKDDVNTISCDMESLLLCVCVIFKDTVTWREDFHEVRETK
jgi:hypothetical protein